MKIDFGALGLVGAVSLVATILVVTITALGVQALANAEEHERHVRPALLQKLVGYTCIGLAGAAVLFGIYLIVPFFH